MIEKKGNYHSIWNISKTIYCIFFKIEVESDFNNLFLIKKN